MPNSLGIKIALFGLLVPAAAVVVQLIYGPAPASSIEPAPSLPAPAISVIAEEKAASREVASALLAPLPPPSTEPSVEASSPQEVADHAAIQAFGASVGRERLGTSMNNLGSSGD